MQQSDCQSIHPSIHPPTCSSAKTRFLYMSPPVKGSVPNTRRCFASSPSKGFLPYSLFPSGVECHLKAAGKKKKTSDHSRTSVQPVRCGPCLFVVEKNWSASQFSRLGQTHQSLRFVVRRKPAAADSPALRRRGRRGLIEGRKKSFQR